MKEGVALPSAALARLLSDPKLAGLEDDDEACYLMLMLTIGAADTVSATSAIMFGSASLMQLT